MRDGTIKSKLHILKGMRGHNATRKALLFKLFRRDGEVYIHIILEPNSK